MDLLEDVFHKDWVMRDTDSPGETRLNLEDRATFIKRVRDHGPYAGYASERVFASVSVVHDQLAFMRITKEPSRSSTSFFLGKVAERWVILDKLWVNVPEESTTIQPSTAYAEVEETLHEYFRTLVQADRQALAALLHEGWDLKHSDAEGDLDMVSSAGFLQHLPKSPPLDPTSSARLIFTMTNWPLRE